MRFTSATVCYHVEGAKSETDAFALRDEGLRKVASGEKRRRYLAGGVDCCLSEQRPKHKLVAQILESAERLVGRIEAIYTGGREGA